MKKGLLIFSFLLILILASTIGYKIVSANEKVDEIQDQIIAQTNLESYLTPYGYTLDNPNIILDPYKISPLTAMILFETPTSEEVTVTIKGKDQNSTYTNTFNSTTKHYIPIYGLYPNYKNEVIITCGNTQKTYTIETKPLPTDLTIESKQNTTNELYFITSSKYPYALDNNNDVRWYLTKNYTNKISRLDNGNILLSTDNLTPNKTRTGLIEIDLLGKIYKQYNISDGYFGTYAETPTSILVLSKRLLEIDKQNGTILNKIEVDKEYTNLNYNKQTNTISLSNQTEKKEINLDTKKESTESNDIQLNEQEIILPLYNSKENYKLTKGVKFNIHEKTKESSKSIFLIGYKKPDKKYKEYNINITKTEDYLQLTGSFSEKDKVYLILDKFLDKKVYDIKEKQTIITKEGLTGKYSIYIKINNNLYKTNNYVNF